VGASAIPFRPLGNHPCKEVRKKVTLWRKKSQGVTVQIKTTYWPKPIPTDKFDWSAIDDATYDGPGCPMGTGTTEQEAIADLMEQLEESSPVSRSVIPEREPSALGLTPLALSGLKQKERPAHESPNHR